MKEPKDNLARVCYFFHKNHVRFVIIGARACALHGHIRATQDIDILINNDSKNIENAIHSIHELYPHLNEEITKEDFYTHVIIKILDEPEIDVSLSAWSVTYESAKNDILKVIVEDVEIPYLGIQSLIQSKTTEREQDKWDIKVLSEILKRNK